MNDRTNILGVSQFINKRRAKDVDLNDIECNIAGKKKKMKESSEEGSDDAEFSYQQNEELLKLAKELDIDFDFDDNGKKREKRKEKQSHHNQSQARPQKQSHHVSQSQLRPQKQPQYNQSQSRPQYNQNKKHTSSRHSGSNSDDDSEYDSEYDSGYDSGYDSESDSKSGSYASVSNSNRIVHEGSELQKKTDEQYRREHINNIMDDMQVNSIHSMNAIRDRDKRANMEMEILNLRDILQQDNIKIDDILQYNADMSDEQVADILKALRVRNAQNRYGSIADESILAVADFIESVFDGNHTYFGKFRPDYTGYRKTVRVKLRRVRGDKAMVVKALLDKLNLGPKARIFLEFLPSLITYPRTRKMLTRSVTDDIPEDMGDAIGDLQEMDN